MGAAGVAVDFAGAAVGEAAVWPEADLLRALLCFGVAASARPEGPATRKANGNARIVAFMRRRRNCPFKFHSPIENLFRHDRDSFLYRKNKA
ncbi:hypothetical protein [Acidomonas methanolica]|uniref:hypothetical protein n=1 Tax=Acidomonas methanolica TaxID=437 RepID=UPI0010429881|nr:hypothetical protein [Acidomonas methanolica]